MDVHVLQTNLPEAPDWNFISATSVTNFEISLSENLREPLTNSRDV